MLAPALRIDTGGVGSACGFSGQAQEPGELTPAWTRFSALPAPPLERVVLRRLDDCRVLLEVNMSRSEGTKCEDEEVERQRERAADRADGR